MRIALIGVSGSGKSEQARRLAKKYRISHISTGDLLRSESRLGQLSDENQQALETGQLVSDDVVRALLDERLRRRDTKRGFVIDGYPRNIPQAQSLDNLLGMLGRPLQIAIYTDMTDDLLIKHNVGRQVCNSCGRIFNKYFSPSKKPDICDHCGVSLSIRNKDTPRAVALRVAEHKKNTAPLITYFRAQHKLRTVAAKGSVEEIHQKVSSIVDMEVRPLEIEAVVSATDLVGDEVNTVIAGGQINRIVNPSPPSGSTDGQPLTPATHKPSNSGGSGASKKKKGTKKAASRKVSARTDTSSTPVKTTAKKAARKKVLKKKTTSHQSTKRKVTPARRAAKKRVTGMASADQDTTRQT